MNSTFSIFYLYSQKQFLLCESPKSAYLYYRDFRIDLLTGVKEVYSLSNFLERLEQLHMDFYSERPLVLHLFYELGYKFVGLEHLLPSNKPMALAIEYQKTSVHKEVSSCLNYELNSQDQIDLEVKEYPKFKSYKNKFQKVYEHLINGDCYQVNLTSQFYFKFKKDKSPQEFIANLWRDQSSIGAYAHCTYIHSMDKLFMSNSPECLFQYKKSDLYSMPIKGTIKTRGIRDLNNAWEKLKSSEKEQAELYMISDLLRNDLAKIELRPAHIIRKKLPLIVPGIVHQFSVIKTKLSNKATLLQVLEALFPGGSITGAPKKRVMKIIFQTEDNSRGFYCGSTVLFHKTLKAASINIRSSEIDFFVQEMQYGAGGGITLQSEQQAEFDETYTKMQSFLGLLGALD